MFLSGLNEISGGCEKIVPVSESFWSNLKFLREDVSIHSTNLWQVAQNSISLLLSYFVAQYVLIIVV